MSELELKKKVTNLEKLCEELDKRVKILEEGTNVKKKKSSKPRKASDYNIFMGSKIQELKKENPNMTHSEIFKKCAELWKMEKEK